MNTRVDEIAEDIFRISTFIPEIAPPAGFTINQFVIDADEPLLYHTGMRHLFPVVSEAVNRVVPLSRLRWVAFAHVESDECGAMNEFLAAAPHAEVAHGMLGCNLSLNDLVDRPPRALADDEVLDLGGKTVRRRVRNIETPHVPHNWESRVLFEDPLGHSSAATSAPMSAGASRCAVTTSSRRHWQRRQRSGSSPASTPRSWCSASLERWSHRRSPSCTGARSLATAAPRYVPSPTGWRRGSRRGCVGPSHAGLNSGAASAPGESRASASTSDGQLR
jgi:hypothetical protein